MTERKGKIGVRDICVFAMLGALMLISKFALEWAPNIHLLGVLTMAYTIVYRLRALIPIYVYVFLNGLVAGFSAWWLPYLYIWAVLIGVTMLLPQNMKKQIAVPVYMTVCGLHGLCFGTLYAPVQAIIMGLSPEKTLAWIAAGFPWDLVHALGNFTLGALIYPLVILLKKLDKYAGGK